MSDVKRIRLFVAARVPEPQLLELKQKVAPIKKAVDDARWTPPENQHLTLKFLGSTPADLLERIASAIDGVASRSAPERIALSGLGAFPGPRRARVLWVGVDDPTGLLGRLAVDLDGALESLGFEPEKRKFTPHLTLARLRHQQNVGEAMESLPTDIRFPDYLVESLDLFLSKLSPHGARYELLSVFPLRGQRSEEPPG